MSKVSLNAVCYNQDSGLKAQFGHSPVVACSSADIFVFLCPGLKIFVSMISASTPKYNGSKWNFISGP